MSLSPLELLELIHGETEDSRVHFCAKGHRGLERLASIETTKLNQLLDTVAPFLEKDGYFSPNGFSKPSKHLNPKTSLPIPKGGKANLQRLNGLFVDIDTGRDELPPDDPHAELTPDAMCRALDNIERQGFPHPTLWAFWGRGFYAFWAFIESLRAWPENIEQTENAQRALGWIHPAIDRNAVDAGRILRIAGTKHSKNGNTTIWRPDAQGAIRYPAEELWARLGVDSRRATQYAITRNPGSAPNRAAGMEALFRNLQRELKALHEARQGFAEGSRRYALTLYAVTKLKTGATPLETQEAVTILASQCRPAFPSHDNDPTPAQIVRDARKMKNEHRTTKVIIERLGISQSEADALGLNTLNPNRVQELEKARISRTENEGRPNRSARHEFVQNFLKTNPNATVREVLEATNAAGIKGSQRSIAADIATLSQ